MPSFVNTCDYEIYCIHVSGRAFYVEQCWVNGKKNFQKELLPPPSPPAQQNYVYFNFTLNKIHFLWLIFFYF